MKALIKLSWRWKQYGKQQGSTLLYVVGALVILGAVGAGIAIMSPSSIQSKIEEEAGRRAYYNALSGLNYIYSMQSVSQKTMGANQFVESMMQNSNIAQINISSTDGFSYILNYNNTNENGYMIAYVLGEVGANNSTLYSYKLLSNKLENYTPIKTAKGANKAKEKIKFSGVYYGDYDFGKAEFNGGVIIKGSLNYLGDERNSYGDNCLHLVGRSIGLEDGTSHVCSNTCVVIDGGVDIYGTVYSQGDVNVKNGKVYGDIHAGGDVSITWAGRVYGNVYVHGKYTTASSSLLNGEVHYNSDIPQECTSFSLPEHEYYASSEVLNLDYTESNNWSGEMTIEGVQDIDDHTYKYSSITTEGGTKLCFDLSKKGSYINLFVSGNVENKGTIYVKTKDNEDCFLDKNAVSKNNFLNFAYSEYASRIYMDANGTVTIKDGSNWLGTIFSKESISIGGGASVVGALYTNQSLNDKNSGGLRLKYVESEYVEKNWP